MQKASNEIKAWFVVFSVVIWIGIYLTGFEVVHWFLYIPAVMLIFAAVTGICPTQLMVFSLLKKKQ